MSVNDRIMKLLLRIENKDDISFEIDGVRFEVKNASARVPFSDNKELEGDIEIVCLSAPSE